MALIAKRKGRSDEAPDSPDSLKYYRDMLLIRRFEEKAGQLYGMGLIGGFCHLYIGQEAVVVGIQAALQQGDAVITGYRDHGHMLACGMEPKGVMAELTGRARGYSHGRAGRCTCSRSRKISSAGTESARPRCRLVPAWPLPIATRKTARSASPISATAPSTRARSMNPSTWPRCGSCRWSM